MELTQALKTIALNNKHISLGAKMVPFAGYNMPVSYTSLNEEHLTVRNGAGVFDVSHMGEFIIKGEHALDLIQRVTSNDASILTDGKIQYSCLPNDTGGIVDDLLVYRIDAKTYMLVVNASNIEKDWNWISKYNTRGVEMHNISDKTSLLAVQGSKALLTLQKLTAVNLSEIPYYEFVKGKFNGIDNIILSNTGYTGAGGFEVYFNNEHADVIWDAIFEAGKEFGIKPIGLGARDTLRLEMGFCLYGNDIDDTTSPIEAGLGWITKFTKEFTNSKALLEQKEKGVARKLVGFELIDRGIPRHDYVIADASGNNIGKVTSGTQSPSLQKAIGMGYVTTAFAKPGTEIYIVIRDKAIKAKVVKLPFFEKLMSAEATPNQKIEVCFSPHDYAIYGEKDTIVVIIDILRATTAICTAFEYGVEKIIPVASIKEAMVYKSKGFLVGAERNAIQLEGFDFGNSPYHFMTDKIKGKTLVITTTNGTQAIEKAKDAYKVAIGSFLNIDILCNWLIAENKNVLLFCSGWKNRFCLEDAMFAGAIADVLSAQPTFENMGDSAIAAKYLYQSAKADTSKFLRNSSHRKRLWDLNLKEDVKYCLSTTKQLDFIPVLENGVLVKMPVTAKAFINA